MLPARRPPALADAGLLVGRLAVGVIFVAHGWQKIVDTGHASVAADFDKLGIPLPDLAAYYAAYVELVGGAALIVGLLTPLAGVLIALDMGGAYWYVHRGHGIFSQNGGYEYVMVLAGAALLLAATGAGRLSLDGVIWRRRENAPEHESIPA
jgi:putative oxidoreductase